MSVPVAPELAGAALPARVDRVPEAVPYYLRRHEHPEPAVPPGLRPRRGSAPRAQRSRRSSSTDHLEGRSRPARPPPLRGLAACSPAPSGGARCRSQGSHALLSRRAKGVAARRRKLSVIDARLQREGAPYGELMNRVLAKEIPSWTTRSSWSRATRPTAPGRRSKSTRAARGSGSCPGRPRGKGNAVREGLRHATGDFILIQDADLEYDVDDYEDLLAPLGAASRPS